MEGAVRVAALFFGIRVVDVRKAVDDVIERLRLSPPADNHFFGNKGEDLQQDISVGLAIAK